MTADSDQKDGSGDRRTFLYIATGAMTTVGTGVAVWPLIDQMNPSADTLALASIEVDISGIAEGEALTVKWRGKPVFIRHRTPDDIAAARADDGADMKHPEADAERAPRPEWLVMVGVCTHLGCIPLGQKETDNHGKFDGWFCPCHGSHYDVSGRIRQGPAPENFEVPEYEFLSDTLIKLG